MKLLNEILGTKYPIIQGGMANIATGEHPPLPRTDRQALWRKHHADAPAGG